MANIVRFGSSIPETLLDKFDALIEEQGYSNRSEAIRDLIRDRLVESQWEEQDTENVGVITLVYNHSTPELTERLNSQQHKNQGIIVSNLHIHLTEHNCLEVIVVRGKSSEIRDVASMLTSVRGVKHGKLSMTTLGEELD